jgi:hypothetical protein
MRSAPSTPPGSLHEEDQAHQVSPDQRACISVPNWEDKERESGAGEPPNSTEITVRGVGFTSTPNRVVLGGATLAGRGILSESGPAGDLVCGVLARATRWSISAPRAACEMVIAPATKQASRRAFMSRLPQEPNAGAAEQFPRVPAADMEVTWGSRLPRSVQWSLPQQCVDRDRNRDSFRGVLPP